MAHEHVARQAERQAQLDEEREAQKKREEDEKKQKAGEDFLKALESDSDSDTVSRSRSGRPGRENTSTISDVSDNVSWNLSSISGMSLESKPKKPPELWHDLQQAIADEQKLKNKKFRKATRRFFRHLKRNFK